MGSLRGLLTSYGNRDLDVASLHGSAVLYTCVDHTIPAGTRWNGNRTLKTPVRWRRGTILVPRLLKTDEPSGTLLWIAHPYGIYEALRALMHIKHGYRGVEDDESGGEERPGEVQKLEGVRDALDLVLSSLALRPKLTRLQREAILTFIRSGAATVGGVRDPAKLRALTHMLNAVREQDTKGRNNPSARMAIVVGAQNDLSDRLALIRFIEPRIGAREIALAHEAVRIRRIFVSAYKTVGGVHLGARIRNRFDWLTRLDRVRSELGGIRVGPYPVHIERLDSDIEAVQVALRQGRTDDARKILGLVLESLRCKKARWVLEELIVKLSLFSRQPDQDPVVATQLAREMWQFSARVAARINDTGFKRPVREPVCGLLETAAAMIERRQPGDLPLQDVLKAAKGLAEGAARRL